MGILGALSTAVSGLSAQSYALENISGNIANSQTVGFKRVDTSFVDLIPEAPLNHAAAGSVASYSNLTNTIQGTLRSTSIPTNMALSGDGYFVVGQNDGSITNPTFNEANLFTRRGDFKIDGSGYLVNGANYYLVGTSYNPATGAVIGSSNTPINISDTPLPAKRTTEVLYSGNLPTIPRPDKYSVTTPGSDRMVLANYTATSATDPVPSTIVGSQVSTFLSETIAGGEITLYTPAGTAATAQLRLGKTGDGQWSLFYQTNSAPGATDAAWQQLTRVTFDGAGKMTSPASGVVAVSAGVTVDGVALGAFDLNFAAKGLTQFGDLNGQATPTIEQNGYPFGTLSGVSVGTDGVITGTYSNGKTAKLAQVQVAHFKANDELKRENGGAFSPTNASGSPIYGLLGTTLSGGAVEESNTDISDEFSKMIVTQQAYSANTRVMSTAQQMLQDVINIVR